MLDHSTTDPSDLVFAPPQAAGDCRPTLAADVAAHELGADGGHAGDFVADLPRDTGDDARYWRRVEAAVAEAHERRVAAYEARQAARGDFDRRAKAFAAALLAERGGC